MPHLLAIGLGYCAQALGAVLAPQGWTISGTSRDGREGTVQWPGTDMTALLDQADHLLISAAPGPEGDPVLAALGPQIAARNWTWVGYLSTTSVYGDRAGGWVDENDEARATSPRGKARLAAEAAWAALPVPLHIFRLAGIYGPGRGPFGRLRAGTARRIVKPDQVFSRIHVEDIATCLAASIAQPNPGQIYNLCDNEPAPPQDVVAYAAQLLGLPIPPDIAFTDADMTPMARAFYSESKRVSNARIREELGVTLRYPTYREGLAACLAAEG